MLNLEAELRNATLMKEQIEDEMQELNKKREAEDAVVQ